MPENRTGILIACLLVVAAAVATFITLALVGTTPPNQTSAPAARQSCACYRAALHSLPADHRVYSSAPDDIRQAMSARSVRRSKPRTLASHG